MSISSDMNKRLHVPFFMKDNLVKVWSQQQKQKISRRSNLKKSGQMVQFKLCVKLYLK